jgi:hypothetical protein
MSRAEAAPILISLGFVPDVDFICTQLVDGTVQITWLSGATQPSEATLNAVSWSPAIEAAFNAQQATKTVNQVFGIRLASDQSTTSGSFVDVPGLSFNLAPNTHYKWRFTGAYTAALATTGLQLSVNGPASPLFLRFVGWLFTGVTAVVAGAGAAYDVALASVASGGATALPFTMEGTISTNSAGGVFTLRFRSEIAGSAVTILKGSIGELMAVL